MLKRVSLLSNNLYNLLYKRLQTPLSRMVQIRYSGLETKSDL